MTSEGGYDVDIVLAWLAKHATRRADGRYLTLNGRTLQDTHRDTFARWHKAAEHDPEFFVPLGRLDEILLRYGVMLHEFDDWAQENFGWDGYAPSADWAAILDS